MLNIDESTEISFHPQFESRSPEPPRAVLGNQASGQTSFHNKTKGKHRLMRSLSDIFKNIPGLWSSKDVKSCSDLKSQTLVTENDTSSRKERSNRLKRSRTTATCSSSFDASRRLESIGEIEMTLMEADQIVNEFLHSSMSSIETLKNREPSLEFGSFPTLSQSDIANGNILPGSISPELDADEFLGLEPQCIDFNLGKAANFVGASGNLEEFFETQLLGTKVKGSEREGSILQFEDSLMCDLNFSHSFDEEMSFPGEYKGSYVKAQTHENKDNKAQHFYRDSFCFQNWDDSEQFSEFSVHATILELPEKQTMPPDANKTDCNEETRTKSGTCKFENSKIDFCQSTKHRDFSDHNSILHSMTTDAKKSILEPEFNQQRDFSESNGPKLILTSPNNRKDNVINHESWQSHSKTFDSTENEINTNLPALNNTNIHRTLSPKKKPLNKCVEALGPFYDADLHINAHLENSTLTSYYSMPELHNLSNFNREYVIYNDSVTNRANSDTLKDKNKHTEIIQDKIYKQLQEILLETTISSEESEAFVIARSDLENEDRGTKLPSPLTKSETTMAEYNIPHLKYFANKNTDFNSEQVTMDDATDEDNKLVKLLPNNQCIFSTPSKSQSISFKQNAIHKNCTKTLDTSSKRRTQSIDAINGMLHFNCANCAKYDEIDQNKPINGLGSDLVQNEFGGKVFEDVNEINSKQNSNQEIFSKYPSLTDFLTKEKQNTTGRRESCKIDQNNIPTYNNSYELEKNEESFNKNLYNSPQACHDKHVEVKYSQEEVGGTKRKYKLFNHAESEPSVMKKMNNVMRQEQYDSTSEEIYANTQKEFSKVSKSCAFSDVCKNESPNWNPIDPVGLLETYHSRSKSEYFKEDRKRLTYGASSLDFDKDWMLHDDPIQDLPTSNPTSSIYPLQESLDEHPNKNKFDVVVNTSQSISRVKSLSSEFESVKNKLKMSEENTDTTLVCDGRSHDNEPPPLNPAIEKSGSLADAKSSSESDLSPQNFNYFYGRVQEEGATVIMHRYHHLFDKDELEDLIENYISDLHVLDYFQEQSHWCIIAEKVRVWTI